MEAVTSVWILILKLFEIYWVQAIVRDPLTNTTCEFIVTAR